MTKIRLIADDLTGALDATVQFGAREPGIPVLLGQEPAQIDAGGRTSAAISTYSRDLDAAAARRAVTRAAPFLAGADIAFVKIDSLLRGNWPSDLAGLLAAFPDHTCIFAPAFPAQRRVMRDGRQYAPGPDGAVAPLAMVPQRSLEIAGLRARIIPRGSRPVADAGGVLICDAFDQADIDALIAAAPAMDCPVLWCGSAGLARALGGDDPPRVAPDTAPPLIVIGSCHPVTLTQLAAVPDSAAVRVSLGPDAARSAESIERALAATACIAMIDLPPGLSPAQAMPIIAQRLTAILPRISPVRNLVVIGGETLAAVCDAVSAEALHIEGELFPGVPCSRLAGGIWHGVHLTSRSGAFGGPAFLADLLATAAGLPRHNQATSA